MSRTRDNATAERYEKPDRPCPVCEGTTKGCSRTQNDLHRCRGEPVHPADWAKLRTNGEWTFYRPVNSADSPPVNDAATSDWAADAKRWAGNLTPALRDALARRVGLPVEALARLPLLGAKAVSRKGTLYTCGEEDGAGRVIGVATRYEPAGGGTAGKKAVAGSKRGLTVPADWPTGDGPMLLVEGLTDVLAGCAAGLAVVGRPSNTGGQKLLAALLADWPADRPILVVGENDGPKEDGSWPGRDGAVTTAGYLTRKLGRPVRAVLPPTGWKDTRAWLTDPARKDVPWPDRGAELAALLTAPEADAPRPTGVTAARPDDLPVIVLGKDEGRVEDEAVAALAADPRLYHRGGLLVTVMTAPEPDPDAPIRRPQDSPYIDPLKASNVRSRLTRMARLVDVKVIKDNPVVTPAHPPRWLPTAIHERREYRELRPLRGVLSYPVFLNDGRILTEPGYDPPSQLLYLPPPGLRVAVPDRPTFDEVRAAAGRLLHIVCDFPFAQPHHRSAFLAAILSPLAWESFRGPAPFFVIDKNVRRAGAGLMADTIAILLTGRRFPVATYTHNPTDLKKEITSLAIAGDRLCLFDNLTGTVGNGVLAAALTSDLWQDRILGVSLNYRGPLDVCWFATSNNVSFTEDIPPRTCPIKLHSDLERPELRTAFEHPDLRRHVELNRGRLLSDALTVLRGWHTAGRPLKPLDGWGGFEGWSGVVRQAVVFAGHPDPGDAREQLVADADADHESMMSLIVAWRKLDPDGVGLTTAKAVAMVKDKNRDLEEERQVLEEFCDDNLNVKSLRSKLRKFRGRNFGGRKLDHAEGTTGGRTRWKVFVVKTPTGDKGGKGESSPLDGDAEAEPTDAADRGDKGGKGGQFQPVGDSERWSSNEADDDPPYNPDLF